MKFITKVLSILTGAISSLCSMGCQKEPECIYGPPAMLKEYQHTGKINHSRDMGENEEKPDLPESEGMSEKIYGPPEMLNNDTNDQDFETLKKVNQNRKDGKLVYGPPPHRDR